LISAFPRKDRPYLSFYPCSRRSARLLLRGVAGLGAALLILITIAACRLWAGRCRSTPRPYFANAITSAHPEFVVSIDHTLVSLERAARSRSSSAGFRVGRRDREAQLTLPEVSVVFGMRAVLAASSRRRVSSCARPELRVESRGDGKFQLGLGGANAAASDWVGDLLHHLAAPPDRKGPLGYLAQVSIRNAVLTVDDRALGVTWRARSADATLFRGESGLLGDMTLMVERPVAAKLKLRSDFRYAKGQGRLALQFGFSALRPALFAGSAPALRRSRRWTCRSPASSGSSSISPP